AYVWSLDTRADALFALGRWEEAVSVLRAAAALDEDGQPNVSQVINLAFMYARLDQPVETRNQLAALRPETVSAYGHMQWVHAQLLAATALGDSVEITRCLEFMRAHQSDARVAYQAALVQTGRLEEAATVLISRLAAPEERADALLSVQRYDPAGVTAATPRSKDFRQQWTRLLQREDVLKAIREVGQIGSYPLRRP
ncbi:MAG: hypothetical protein JOZ03_02940, partial [Gammaproteobacteria bacterium]|nr:hypothetical protein [Gammaproteobacteria bacterium]